MATTSNDIQNLIDSKVALIASIVTQIASVISSPKPSYDIDGQAVQWNTYMKYLTEMQKTEVESLKLLYELENIINPYQFQSVGNGNVYGWGGWI